MDYIVAAGGDYIKLSSICVLSLRNVGTGRQVFAVTQGGNAYALTDTIGPIGSEEEALAALDRLVLEIFGEEGQ